MKGLSGFCSGIKGEVGFRDLGLGVSGKLRVAFGRPLDSASWYFGP